MAKGLGDIGCRGAGRLFPGRALPPARHVVGHAGGQRHGEAERNGIPDTFHALHAPRQPIGARDADDPQADEGNHRGGQRVSRAVDDAVADEDEGEEEVAGADGAQVGDARLDDGGVRDEDSQERARNRHGHRGDDQRDAAAEQAAPDEDLPDPVQAAGPDVLAGQGGDGHAEGHGGQEGDLIDARGGPERGRRDLAKAIDDAGDEDHADGDERLLNGGGQADAQRLPGDGAQVVEPGPGGRDGDLLGAQVEDQRGERQDLRDHGGPRGAIQAEPREPQPAEHQHGIQRRGEEHGAQLEVERCFRVAHPLEQASRQEEAKAQGQREQEDPEVVGGGLEDLRGRVHGAQHPGGEELSQNSEDDPQGADEHGGAVHDLAQLVHAPRAEALRHQDVGRHREAHADGEQDEDDGEAHRHRGERGGAQVLAHPDGIDEAVGRLEEAAQEHRQGERNHVPGNAAGRQVTSEAWLHARSLYRRGGESTVFRLRVSGTRSALLRGGGDRLGAWAQRGPGRVLRERRHAQPQQGDPHQVREQQVDELHPHRGQQHQVGEPRAQLKRIQHGQLRGRAFHALRGPQPGQHVAHPHQQRAQPHRQQRVQHAQPQQDVRRLGHVLLQTFRETRGRKERVPQRGDGPRHPQEQQPRDAHAHQRSGQPLAAHHPP
ncbi:conserved hypothetical protein [Stigmatella aurantiaca DW4/3-1]|uniref:Uncharacterized protein n=1 Tax=Stigmatella aurantiaca (strain DW4/3-1) TaxID=378806 RepID=Q08QK5_STIAD|nr:conserved hypothetical protein [Stigmatella aurantiaca DW4/3-1]